MKKIIINTILCLFYCCFVYGQFENSLQIKEESKRELCFAKQTEPNQVFETSTKGVFYIKEFTPEKTLKGEGYAIKLKKSKCLIKHGDWIFYDKNGFVTSNCCFQEGVMCSGCHFFEYDENGNKKPNVTILDY